MPVTSIVAQSSISSPAPPNGAHALKRRIAADFPAPRLCGWNLPVQTVRENMGCAEIFVPA